jgi:hypothetical protein
VDIKDTDSDSNVAISGVRGEGKMMRLIGHQQVKTSELWASWIVARNPTVEVGSVSVREFSESLESVSTGGLNSLTLLWFDDGFDSRWAW